MKKTGGRKSRDTLPLKVWSLKILRGVGGAGGPPPVPRL